MTEFNQFWGTFVGTAISALVLIALPLARGRFRVMGITARDFSQFNAGGDPFSDPGLTAAANAAFSGWRLPWLVAVFALISAAMQTALQAALPETLPLNPPWLFGLRTGLGVAVSWWLTGRVIVASIHRHASATPATTSTHV